MKRRVEGKEHGTHKGLAILSREEFYLLFENDPEFLSLFNRWRAAFGTLSSPRLRKVVSLRPTPDRRDGLRGYVADNISWLTYSENSSKR